MRNLIKNKRGEGTFEGWGEGMMFFVLFLLVFTIIIVGMNFIHDGEDHEVEGLDTSSIQERFESYQSSMEDRITGGEASFLFAVGLTLSTSWNILTSLFSMLMYFVGGGFIQTIISYLKLPDIVGFILRGLFITALGFIILRALFNKTKI